MKTLLSISLICLLLSCEGTGNKRKDFKLQVAVNPNFIKYLDYPSIPHKKDDKIYYDSIHNKIISVFDSLPATKIPITIFSMLTDDFRTTVDLQSDTTITLDSTQFLNLISGSRRDFLSLAGSHFDTIYIGQKLLGCFGGYTEKIVSIKHGKSVKVYYKKSNTPDFNSETVISDSSFMRLFDSFIIEANKLFPVQSSGQITIGPVSTTTIDTYIRKGNIIYSLPDLYDWKGYDSFKKGIGIQLD